MNYKPEITRAEFDEHQDEIKTALFDVISEEIKAKKEFTAWLDSDDSEGGDIKPHGGLIVPTASVIDSPNGTEGVDGSVPDYGSRYSP